MHGENAVSLTMTDQAAAVLRKWLARDPARPALRIAYAGGCGALGYRLTQASAPIAGDQAIAVSGFTVYVDYKTAADLDGARIEVGTEDFDDDVVIVHDRAIVGGLC